MLWWPVERSLSELDGVSGCVEVPRECGSGSSSPSEAFTTDGTAYVWIRYAGLAIPPLYPPRQPVRGREKRSEKFSFVGTVQAVWLARTGKTADSTTDRAGRLVLVLISSRSPAFLARFLLLLLLLLSLSLSLSLSPSLIISPASPCSLVASAVPCQLSL